MRLNSKVFTIKREYRGRLYRADVEVTLTGNTTDDIAVEFDGSIEVSELFDKGGKEYSEPLFVLAMSPYDLDEPLRQVIFDEAKKMAIADGSLIGHLDFI